MHGYISLDVEILLCSQAHLYDQGKICPFLLELEQEGVGQVEDLKCPFLLEWGEDL
jgi:hypothetical protein